MVYKELVLQFIQNDDGTISVKFKPDNEHSFSDYEIYMAYRTIYQFLHDLNFDWSIESTIETKVQRRDNNERGN